MKKLAIGLLLPVMLSSCVNNTNTSDNGYCTKTDTTYKDNSTEIDKVMRTFYINGDEINDFLKVAQYIGENDYIISIHKDDAFASKVLSSELFKSFIVNSKTIMKNKEKNLHYDLGDSIFKNSTLSHSNIAENGINIQIENIHNKSVYYELSKNDFENLENALNMFNSGK